MKRLFLYIFLFLSCFGFAQQITTGGGTANALTSPFSVGATSVTTTGTQLNYLNAAAGTTGTASTNLVFSTSPTLVTPILGTPQSVTLTNGTGLPVSTGVSGLGTGVATFLATPSSANLASAVTDETGSGSVVFSSAPTLTNPIVGTQSPNDNSTKAASTAYVDNGRTGYTMMLQMSNTAVNPADGQNYYFGIIFNALNATANIRTMSVPITGTLVGATINIYSGGLGTNESSSMYVRINNTTDVTISTSIDMSALMYHTTTALNTAVTAGDNIEIKWTTPAWVTNPTTVLCNVVLRFK